MSCSKRLFQCLINLLSLIGVFQGTRMKIISRVLQKVPGQRIFGMYRFLPLFFIVGAALEFTMIKWEVRGTNFYKTFKRRRAEEIAAQEIASEIRKQSYKDIYTV